MTHKQQGNILMNTLSKLLIKIAYIDFWLIVVSVFLLDLITKNFFLQYWQPYEVVEVLPFLNLVLAFNTGAAFSFLADAGGWQRWFFIILTIAVCIYLLVLLSQAKPQQRFYRVGLALIIAGALGNLYDRIMHGFVVDFIDFHINQWHWPAFNVADSGITIGAIMLIIQWWVLDKKEAGK